MKLMRWVLRPFDAVWLLSEVPEFGVFDQGMCPSGSEFQAFDFFVWHTMCCDRRPFSHFGCRVLLIATSFSVLSYASFVGRNSGLS